MGGRWPGWAAGQRESEFFFFFFSSSAASASKCSPLLFFGTPAPAQKCLQSNRVRASLRTLSPYLPDASLGSDPVSVEVSSSPKAAPPSPAAPARAAIGEGESCLFQAHARPGRGLYTGVGW